MTPERESSIRFRASMEDAPQKQLLQDVRDLLDEITRLRFSPDTMTPRDQFAAAALPFYLAHGSPRAEKDAYETADAMMEARKK